MTEPTVVHVPLEMFGHRTPTEAMFGARAGYGKASETDLLGASLALWVTWVLSLTWESALSRVAVTLNSGE